MEKYNAIGQDLIVDDKWLVRFIMLACFLSNLSQMPFLVSAGETQLLNTPVWLLLLGYLFLKKRVRLTYQMAKPLGALVVAVTGILVCMIVSGSSYLNSSVLNCLLLSLFIYCLGGFSGGNISEAGLRSILWTYVFSAVLVSICVYIEFFAADFHLSSRVYAYSSKNSISQIILTAAVILMFLDTKGRRLWRGLKIAAILFEIFLMCLLRSRATIVGFFLCLAYIIAGKQFNRKLKRLLLFAFIAGTAALLCSDTLSDIFFDQILFAGRDITDIDMLSSGRMSILQSFPTQISGHWLTGVGALYFECFPLSVILQFGIFAGPVILGISYLPIIKSVFYKRNSVYVEIFVVICIAYAINSLFEGLAPIGPGVKCYFMWLLYGLLQGREKKMWTMREAKEA